MIDDLVTGLAEVVAETAIEIVGEAVSDAGGMVIDLISEKPENIPANNSDSAGNI